MKPHQRLEISQEYIAYQRKESIEPIVALWREIETVYREQYHNKPVVPSIVEDISQYRALEAATFKRFGLKVRFTFVAGSVDSVLMRTLNGKHPFVDEDEVENAASVVLRLKSETGYVDLKNAKVSGFFSEVQHYYLTNPYVAFGVLNYTAEEACAVYLHEIGHLFNLCEFSHRLEKTNFILAEMAEALTQGDKKKVEYLYVQYQDSLGNASEKFSGSRIVFGLQIVKDYLNLARSFFPESNYTNTQNETSADVFVVRMGYGQALAQALSKHHQAFGYEFDGRFAKVAFMGFDFAQVLVAALTIVKVFVSGLSGVILLAVLTYFANRFFGSANEKFTYEDLQERYRKMRSQYVNLLKNTQLSKQDQAKALETIEWFDALIKSTYVYRPVYSKIVDAIIPRHRKAAQDIAFQRLLEELGNNELFIRAAQFSQYQDASSAVVG